nr:unnamed protein product [Callosobruchus chinensis]
MFETTFQNFQLMTPITLEKNQKRYLGNHLNISRMYRLYLEECNERGLDPKILQRSGSMRRFLTTNTTIHLRVQTTTPAIYAINFSFRFVRRNRLIHERNYKLITISILLTQLTDINEIRRQKKVKENLLQKRVVMIDLQKCLPTPELHNSQSFYSSSFGHATHDNSFCMMWDEGVAGRGGNEVASCLINGLNRTFQKKSKK